MAQFFAYSRFHRIILLDTPNAVYLRECTNFASLMLFLFFFSFFFRSHDSPRISLRFPSVFPFLEGSRLPFLFLDYLERLVDEVARSLRSHVIVLSLFHTYIGTHFPFTLSVYISLVSWIAFLASFFLCALRPRFARARLGLLFHYSISAFLRTTCGAVS